MKTELSLYNNYGSSACKHKVEKPYIHPEIHRLKYNDNKLVFKRRKNNYADINRPTESVSFSGSAALNMNKAVSGFNNSANQKIAKWASNIASSEKFNKALDFSVRNESKLSAIISLGLAGIIKPFVVLAMPGAEREDKEVTATKNALSAFIGYGLSCAILDPISSGVNKFINNPENYLPKDNRLVKEFAKNRAEEFVIHSKEELKNMPYKSNTLNAFRSTYKKGLGIIVAPVKAALTIAIMPYILELLFGDKAKKTDKENPNKYPIYMEPLNNPNLTPDNSNNIFKDAFVSTKTHKDVQNLNENKFKSMFAQKPTGGAT